MTQWIITSCVLILAILGLRFALKGRISLGLQYALWLLVAVRLLLPVSFGESSFSAANLSYSAQSVVQQMETVQIPLQSFDSAYEEVVQEHIQQGQDISGSQNTEKLEYEAYERMDKISLPQILTAIWVMGMGLSFVCLLLSNLHFSRRLRKTRRAVVLPGCKLPVYCAPQIVTPCLFGLFRPAIYLTEDVLADSQALEHVLVHESTHYRHGDHIWALVRGLCLCVHWYNPLVWIAARVSRNDAELACDEAAIARLGEENRTNYGRTLIGLTCAGDHSPLLTATTMTGSKHSIKERITLIAKKPEFSVIALIALILAVTLAAGCSFTGPAEEPLDYTIYAFPGTEWGMTMEQVMDALKLTEDDVTTETANNGNNIYMTAEFGNVFGAPAEVTFIFQLLLPEARAAAKCCFLTDVQAIYPDETDMNKVRTQLIQAFGEPTLPDAPPYLNLARLAGTEGHVSRWDSDTLTGEYISDEYAQLWSYASLFAGPHPDEVEEMKQIPAVTLWWTDDSRWYIVGAQGVDETAEPGLKAIRFSSTHISRDRAYTQFGYHRPIDMDDSKFSAGTIYSLRSSVLPCIITQEQAAGIKITDAKINIREVEHKAHSRKKDTDLLVYEVSWQVKPAATEGVILQEDEILDDGRIKPADPMYFLVRYEYNLEGQYPDGTAYTDRSTVVGSFPSLTELEAAYSTPEMLAEYGDMYTAFAMTTAKNAGISVEYNPAE